MAIKDRADNLLLAQGLSDSREQAKRLILAGAVRTPDQIVAKPGQKLALDTPLSVTSRPPYVSRGGFKLAAALDAFSINPAGLTCLDIGASTGGFTDCLLQREAAKVHAIDVGTNQLVWSLRNDPRVFCQEKFNARHLTIDDLGETVDLIVIDVSFISLTKILAAAFAVLSPSNDTQVCPPQPGSIHVPCIIALIKPQFELQRDEIGRGGIVKDPALHEKAINKIKNFTTKQLHEHWAGHIASPIQGSQGNTEFLAYLTKQS